MIQKHWTVSKILQICKSIIVIINYLIIIFYLLFFMKLFFYNFEIALNLKLKNKYKTI